MSRWSVRILLLMVSAVMSPSHLVADDTQWHFMDWVGLEGQAYAVEENGTRIEVECGNGGGPAITLLFPSPLRPDWGSEARRVNIRFEIDGKPFTDAFEWHPGGKSCGSVGFPSDRLIAAIRRGSHMVVRHDGTFRAAFTLKGSNAAIAPLSACLDPPARMAR